MTTLLITGALGFIGRNLAEQLRCDYDVTAPDRFASLRPRVLRLPPDTSLSNV